MDGLDGPCLSGTGFYMKRQALYGISIQDGHSNLDKLRQTFGYSEEFIKSLNQRYKRPDPLNTVLEGARLLASCQFENKTKWGEEASIHIYIFITFSVKLAIIINKILTYSR